ncbi:carbonic anhydrase 1-like [Vespula squamosa]|uniref:Carbonic anhydrase 1-like n=1 Tax=Vespula squamosa TaxID=30214 RepID=A0ABD2A2T3_VESSQ
MEENADDVNLENARFIQNLGYLEGDLPSPIDLDISNMTKINLAPLQWFYHDIAARKVKITNTGQTAVLGGRWLAEDPYINGGPLNGNYVFSQMHFHWGETEMYGSEHRADGANTPMELHVVHFKTQYSTLEEALRQVDGVIIIVYFLKLQGSPNIFLKEIISALPSIKIANTSFRLVPMVLTNIFKPFTKDYFIYWGSTITTQWTRRIMWLVCREPVGIAKEQIDEFRNLYDEATKPILGNSRPLQNRGNRHIFHVCPSGSLHATLLPISREQVALSSQANPFL